MDSEKPGTNEVLIQDSQRGLWMRFRNPLRVLVAHQIREVVPVLRLVEAAVESERLTAVGYLGYESAAAFDPLYATRQIENDFPLAWFGIYERGEKFFLPRCETDFPIKGWLPSISREAYSQAIRWVRDYIAAGETYQVNFSFRLRTMLEIPPWQFFLHLISGQAPGYGAYIETDQWTVCSASPELFFRLRGENLLSRPMKGTISRGRWIQEDKERAESLRTSAKNRAENLMIVDMVRNDLGRIAKTGSVTVERLFEIEKYPTLLQMTSTVGCRTEASLVDIFGALFAGYTQEPLVSYLQDAMPDSVLPSVRLSLTIQTEAQNTGSGAALYGTLSKNLNWRNVM